MKKQTLIDLFEESVKTYASNTFLMEKTGKVWTHTSYEETRQAVYRLGAGLVSLGVKPGDHIALLSEVPI